MSYRDAQRIALADLNGPEPLPLDVWADQATVLHETLQRIGVHDDAVDSAARLAPALAGGSHPGAAQHMRDALAEVGSGDWLEAAQQSRNILAIATHAALPQITHEPQRTLMASIEQRALQHPARPPAVPLATALAQWRDTVAVAAPACAQPTVAAAVAFTQAQLLRLTQRTLDRVEIAPGADVAGLRNSIARVGREWVQMRQRLLTNATEPTEPRAYQMTQSIGIASAQLRSALTTSLPSSPSLTLTTLLESSIGGQGTAAMAMEAGRIRGTRNTNLLSLTKELSSTVDNFIATPTPNFTDKIVTTEATRQVIGRDEQPVAATSTPSARSGVSVPDTPDRLPMELQRELARRRDAGVVAQAALNSDPSALQLTTGASPEELKQLVDDGRQAQAQFVASSERLVSWMIRRFPAEHRDENTQTVMLELSKAAATFDPEVASWVTYATLRGRGALTDQLERNTKQKDRFVPQDFQDQQEYWGRNLTAPDEPETEVLQRSNVRHILDAVEALPSSERAILSSYLSNAHLGPGVIQRTAQDQQVSERTVQRRLRDARRSLRSAITDSTPDEHHSGDAANDFPKRIDDAIKGLAVEDIKPGPFPDPSARPTADPERDEPTR